jgi:antitoxin (DNA-binding transcriptional repressor) of toxin-antitoxin stability system
MCYIALVKTISQRELRNENASVMCGVEQGETYAVTRRGVPVAILSPISEDSDLRCVRPAKKRPLYSKADRVVIKRPSAEILDDLRGDR